MAFCRTRKLLQYRNALSFVNQWPQLVSVSANDLRQCANRWPPSSSVVCLRSCSSSGDKRPPPLFVPVPVKVSNNPDDINIGEELSAKLNKDEIKKLLSEFFKRPEIRLLSEENGLNGHLFKDASISFIKICTLSEGLPTDLHIIFSDILQGAGHIDDLLPYFLRHAKEVFPHLQCMDDLKKISDLRLPANWYPEARSIDRKIIFHSGPTNSGKTYHALERFSTAKSGVYCGPLKLLAVEVHSKTNKRGIPCDLVTGEDKQYANADQSVSTHVACTVEMTSLTTRYEVAVIDEIQMIKEMGRGWAWTRALLGVAAEEIHVCGEEAAIGLVQSLCAQIGEEVEVRKYKRLTGLTIENTALENVDNLQPGDCIVCFSKADIYTVSRMIEKNGKQCAVIYGGLPPGTKLAQTNKFNDATDPCKILVATDAIGMGLNLSIRRIIFYSLIKPTLNDKGEKEMDTISTSQALQIGGRAGRFGTEFSEGSVTTFKQGDLDTLRGIMSRPVEPIKMAGLHPTADQIELFAYHLPQTSLAGLMDIFVSLSQVDDSYYFMCQVDDFKFLADMIEHIPLPLRARYVFCCSPINKKHPFVCTMFLKFVRKYSTNEALTFDWLCRNTGWPLSPPKKISDLVHLESIFDILDLYLWLSYRFPDLFPDVEVVRSMQQELDSIIQKGILQMAMLLKKSETLHSHGTDYDDSFDVQHQKTRPDIAEETWSSSSTSKYLKNKVVVPTMKSIFNADEKADDGTEDESENTLEPPKIGHGRLANHLVSQGMLTPRMLHELRKEWLDEKEEKGKLTKGSGGKKFSGKKRK